MSYTKQTWLNSPPSKDTPLSAARFNHMEDGIEAADATASAAVPSTRKINGQALSGDVTLIASDVGLGNVDNTSDATKPISTATASALATKADADETVSGSANGTSTSLVLWTGTAAQFAAVTPKDPATVYVYPGGVSIGGQSVVTTRTSTATVTVDHTKVTAALTGFPLYVDLSSMPAGFWETVTPGGGSIRCYAGSTQLAREVVSCDPVTKTGELHVKTDLSSTKDTVLTISVEGASSEPGIGSPFGARAVWSDYSLVSHDGGLTDVLGNVPDLSAWIANPGSSPTTYTLTPNQYQLPGVGVGLLGSKGGSYFTAGDSGVRWPKTVKAVAQMSLWAKPIQSGNRVIVDHRQIGENGQIITSSSSTSFGNGFISVQTFVAQPGRVALLNAQPLSSAVSLNLNLWNYLVVKTSTSTPFPTDLTLGQAAIAGGANFNGLFDEFRLCDIARSAGWIAAEYANQSSPASFYTAAPA